MTPTHYRQTIEPIEVMEQVAENPYIPRKLGMLVGQSIKYLLRLGRKGAGYEHDLDKAIDYLWRARHGVWFPTFEVETGERQQHRIKNLFKLTDHWLTAFDVTELLLIPEATAFQLLKELARLGELSQSGNPNRTHKEGIAFKRKEATTC